MKIFSFVFVALCTVGLVACVNEDISFEKGNISRDIAYKLVLKELKEWNISLNEVDIWASEQKVAGNTGGFGSDDNLTSPDSESWFFLVDERPLDNWGHPCRYLFVDMNGIVYVYQQTMPPKFFDDMVLLNVSETTKNYNYYPITPTKKGTRSEDIPLLSHHYAIIISGGWSSTLNFPRYWNDCAEIYTTLTDQYGYDPSKIFVLMADGTDPGIDNSLNESSNPDLDGDSIDDIDFAATCSNLDSVFDSLAVHLTTDDYLFIYTIDHGDIDWFLDDSFLAMWNNEKYFASRFANKVHSITAKAIHIVMGQCHSGGFVEYFTNTPNVCISTACGKYEDSHPSVNGLYDEYVHLWTQSHNTTISDANGDGKITAKESHLYAKFRDTCNETPCHYGGSGYLSERLTLTGTYQNTYDSYIDGYCVFNNLSNYSFYAGVHIHEPEFGIPSGGSVDIFLT